MFLRGLLFSEGSGGGWCSWYKGELEERPGEGEETEDEI